MKINIEIPDEAIRELIVKHGETRENIAKYISENIAKYIGEVAENETIKNRILK